MDHSTNSSHIIKVKASSQDGSTAEANFQVNVVKITDIDNVANAINLESFDNAYFGIQLQTIDGTSTLSNSELSLFDNANNAISYDTSTGKLHLTSASKLDYTKNQNIQIDVGLTSDQVKEFNIPLYQHPKFTINSPPKADKDNGDWSLGLDLKALQNYQLELSIDGTIIGTISTPSSSLPLDQEVSWKYEYTLPSTIGHGSHVFQIKAISPNGIQTTEQKSFYIDLSHDPDASVYYNANSIEIGYKVGFLAKPGSTNKVEIDDGTSQKTVSLTLEGNIATASLSANDLAGLKDGTLMLKYYSDDVLVHQSNFLYMPNQTVLGMGSDADRISESSIPLVKQKIGTDDFRDIHGDGAHLEIPSEGGLVLHKDDAKIQLLSSDKDVSKAYLSENEQYVAFQTSEQLTATDQNNLEDIYVINTNTKNIVFQSDAHGDRPVNATLIGIKNSGEAYYQSSHNIDYGDPFSSKTNPSTDKDWMVFDNALGAPKAATIAWDMSEGITNQSDRRLGSTPSGLDFFVSKNADYAATEKIINFNNGPYVQIVDLNDIANSPSARTNLALRAV